MPVSDLFNAVLQLPIELKKNLMSLLGKSLEEKPKSWNAWDLEVGDIFPPTGEVITEQHIYVRDSLKRALDEVEEAKRTGRKLQSDLDFIRELKEELKEEEALADAN